MGFQIGLRSLICFIGMALVYPGIATDGNVYTATDGEKLGLRFKRATANSDLVADMSYNMKRNKSITALSAEEKQAMLDMTNAYRSLVRPAAADMIEVTWDDEIAVFAQEWADACTATHRPNRDLDPWINMGENLYWWYSGKYNVHTSVKWWWDEVEWYDFGDKSCTPDTNDKVCGHYVTLVWAKTSKIGCGVARCDRLLDHPDYGRGAYYFVCSYSGRFLSNTRPYVGTDQPCSSCHNTDFPKCRYNLCVTQEMIDKDIGYNGDTSMTGLNRTYTFSHQKSPPEASTEAPNTAEETSEATEQPQQQSTASPTSPSGGSGASAETTESQQVTASAETTESQQVTSDSPNVIETTASVTGGVTQTAPPGGGSTQGNTGRNGDTTSDIIHLNSPDNSQSNLAMSFTLIIVSFCSFLFINRFL